VCAPLPAATTGRQDLAPGATGSAGAKCHI
jgi:hypothetical protein